MDKLINNNNHNDKKLIYWL